MRSRRSRSPPSWRYCASGPTPEIINAPSADFAPQPSSMVNLTWGHGPRRSSVAIGTDIPRNALPRDRHRHWSSDRQRQPQGCRPPALRRPSPELPRSSSASATAPHTEIGYMLYSRADTKAEADFLRDVADDVYQLVAITPADAARAADLVEKYANLPLGTADAFVV